jgi:hypothetical protein
MIRDFFRFLFYNALHYSRALWGVCLQLEPDYPVVTRFFPSLIRDSVYEYRSYGAIPLWGLVVSYFPMWFSGFLVGWYIAETFRRVGYFKSSYVFWKQAYKECPNKSRVQSLYTEWIIREVERRMKTGHSSLDVAPLEREAFEIQERICQTKI